MKIRKLIIVVAIVLLVILAGWTFTREGVSPTGETPRTGEPFGSGDDINIPAISSEDTIGQTTQFDEEISQMRLFRISNTPVAGFVTLAQGSDVLVRYVERATGHIFDAVIHPAGTPEVLEKIRITNQTLPKIHEAYFRSDGLGVVLRSFENDLETIENLSLELRAPRAASSSALYSVSATSLRGNIDQISGLNNSLIYTIKGNPSSIISSSFSGSNLRTLFSSSFSDWRLGRLGGNSLIYAKASSVAPGYAYSLSSSGGLNKILGPLNGLVALGSPSGREVLYSYSSSNTMKLSVKNLQQESDLEILPSTLAEKCVWSTKTQGLLFCGVPVSGVPRGEPDGWYRGATHFTDNIWRFDTRSEIAQLVIEPMESFELSLDVSEPQLSQDEKLLIFINRNDLTLWAMWLN